MIFFKNLFKQTSFFLSVEIYNSQYKKGHKVNFFDDKLVFFDILLKNINVNNFSNIYNSVKLKSLLRSSFL